MSKSVSAAIRSLTSTNDEIYSLGGKVVAVDLDQKTCDVKLTGGGADVYDVLLQAVEGGNQGLILVPEVDSDVLISFLSPVTAYVAMTSKITSLINIIDNSKIEMNETGIVLQKENTRFVLTSSGTEISRNGASLKVTLDSLIDAIMAITVGTISGPSTVPINAPQFVAIKNVIAQILT